MTFDIYTNRIPLGLLTEDEQAALKAHPGPWEYWSRTQQWKLCQEPSWFNVDLYRAVKPALEPLWIAPEVWAVLDKKWCLAAKDENGKVFFYEEQPEKRSSYWYTSCCFSQAAFAPHLIRPGTVAWDQSLIQRPEGV
jgi:hypothetical protein